MSRDMPPKDPRPRPTDCERTRVRAQPLAIVEPPRPHVADAPATAADAPSRRRPQGFDVHTDLAAGHVGLLTVTGALDADSEASLLTAARFALAHSYVLVLDLRRLSRCDPAGVRAVLAVDALARAIDALLVIRPAAPAVHRAFAQSDAAGRLRFVGPDDVSRGS